YGEEYSFITTPLFSGSGTEAVPYQVSNLDELRFLSEHSVYWDSYFIQTANIDATDTQNWNSGAGFAPIGNSSNYFSGDYDGQGYSIDGLFINRPSSDNVGLFGSIDSADIYDLGLTSVNITGDEYVGALVGDNSESSVNNCSSTGSVSGEVSIGGLVGSTYYSSVNYSYSTGNVNGNEYVGGLVGENDNSPISDCYSTGSVDGGNCTGGLVGYNQDSSPISNSYSTGNVSGDLYVGGLVGDTFQDCSVTNCFSTGNVDGNEFIAGLLGVNESGCTIVNCFSTGNVSGDADLGGLVSINYGTVTASFWDTETSGQSTSAGGSGKTTSEMITQSTFTDVSWDFVYETANGTVDIWTMNGFDNLGYPFFTGNNLAPVLVTTIASSITGHTASSGGEILDSGQTAITTRGVCWSTSANPTLLDNFTENGTGSGTFISDLTNLSSSTTYYYRAYATNSIGTGYGDE
ncbi:MAG: hypothetical protein K8S23_01815, partial [Candidatus Cloacimonetes bacterium]|nr:hypothetical protein [Candidatus Cloacimonadota bacterium]